MTEEQLISKLNYFRSLPSETEVFEFKEAKNNYDFNKLGKYFSALSNEANLKNKNDAWLIFGIENNKKTIVGSKYRIGNRPYLDSLKGEIANKTNNRITFIEIYELNILPEGRVLMFQIPAAPKGIPVSWEGHFYGRDGEDLSPLNIEEIERIRNQVKQNDWSASICNNATVSDLDPTAIEIAKANFKIKNTRIDSAEIDSWDVMTFLNKAKLTINGKITNTAILLLGKPESDHHIAPAIARITWVLKNLKNEEKDYEHFGCPFLLSVNKVFTKIRNLKFRYINDTLFPEVVDRYDPYNIKEALSNCIAHQDYTLSGRINVVEIEDEQLIFTNSGDFLPGSIENVLESDQPPAFYRNNFLVQAMVNLNMIDTVGSGIKRMFKSQREKFFPMPDFDLSNRLVKLKIIGKVLNIEYAKVLAKNPNLTLEEIILLDKVQKEITLSDEEVNILKRKKLIEGRKPKFIISENLAIKTKQVGAYLKNRGFDKDYYKKLTLEFIQKNDIGSNRTEIRDLLWNKLSDVLTEDQKERKISKILTELKNEGKIENAGNDTKPNWKSIH